MARKVPAWFVENDGEQVSFRGTVETVEELEKVIAALSVRKPLLANQHQGINHDR